MISFSAGMRVSRGRRCWNLAVPLAVASLLAGSAACSAARVPPRHGHRSSPTSVSVGNGGSGTSTAPDGLVAFVDNSGIEVADPDTGAIRLAVAIPSPKLGSTGTGRFLVDGPVWGASPGVNHPVVYFVLHPTQSGAPGDDFFFRDDPFGGSLKLIAALPDVTGQTQGLTYLANALYYATGCCEDIGIDSLALSGPYALRPAVVEKPGPGMWFTLQDAFRGYLAAVNRVPGGPARYAWVQPGTGRTAALELPEGLATSTESVGQVAMSASGSVEALSVVSSSGGGSLVVDDLVSHSSGKRSLVGSGPPSGMAFAPRGRWLAVSTGGSVQIVYATPSATAIVPPDPYHLSTSPSDAQSISWSQPISDYGFTDVMKASRSVTSLLEASGSNAPTTSLLSTPSSPPSTTAPASASSSTLQG